MAEEKSAAEEMHAKFEALAFEARAIGVQSLVVLQYHDSLAQEEEVLYYSTGGMTRGLGMALFAVERERKRLKDFIDEGEE